MVVDRRGHYLAVRISGDWTFLVKRLWNMMRVLVQTERRLVGTMRCLEVIVHVAYRRLRQETSCVVMTLGRSEREQHLVSTAYAEEAD